MLTYNYFIEWQKRKGLPHSHNLTTFKSDHKFKTPDDINRIVCAEIPKKNTCPELFEIVMKHMIHGPCAPINLSCPCLEVDSNGKKICTKGFPKSFSKETHVLDGSYPVYRRRSPLDGGECVEVYKNNKKITVDNSWVIPYNPLLSLLFDCHINVEIVHSIGSVKYLVKYQSKGPDRSIVKMGESVDEVESFLNCRYLGAGESSWKIFGFEIHGRSHSIEKLAIHLENEQIVQLPEGAKIADIIKDGPPETKLTAFFKLAKTDSLAQTLTYPDIPKFFTWDSKNKIWKKRLRGGDKVIGRVPSIGLNVHQIEIYSLRLLLHKVKGPTSYSNLRTVNGVECETYKDACLEMGLLEDDKEQDQVIIEAQSLSFGNQLVDCFTTLLLLSTPTKPEEFYSRHRKALIQDFLKMFDNDEVKAENKVLTIISSRLRAENKSLEDFSLPKLVVGDITSRLIKEETSYDTTQMRKQATEAIESMTDEQKAFFNEVISAINTKSGECFCLTAPGGCGKSFLFNALLDAVRSDEMIAFGTALSALAATLLHNGTTFHSRAKIPIPCTDSSMCQFTANEATGQLFRMCKLMIIDEVTMGDKELYHCLDRSLQDIRNDKRPFGGLTIVFGGDWRQILPVIPRGSRGQIVNR